MRLPLLSVGLAWDFLEHKNLRRTVPTRPAQPAQW